MSNTTLALVRPNYIPRPTAGVTPTGKTDPTAPEWAAEREREARFKRTSRKVNKVLQLKANLDAAQATLITALEGAGYVRLYTDEDAHTSRRYYIHPDYVGQEGRREPLPDGVIIWV